jgi:hypothetical protein
VEVRLQSGEVRRVSKDACATIGVSSNIHHHYRQLGKAGRSRWLNIRPTVRGVAMNKGKYSHILLSCDMQLMLIKLIILTVVAVVNPRVTVTLLRHGASP